MEFIKNDALRVLEKTALTLEAEWKNRDRHYGELRRQYRELDEAFRQKYQGDALLLKERLRLVDAVGEMLDYEKQYRFLLGLQLGLQLRETRVFEGEEV